MYNKATLVGRLGRVPEVRYTKDGKAIANLAIATSETWKDKNSGEKREKTEWHRVVLFGNLAEIAKDHLSKGSQVLVEGPIRTNKWKDQEGQDRYTTEIHAETMKMLSSNKAAATSGSVNNPAANHEPSTTASTQSYASPQSYDDFNDDIPF